jgi:hypothetical protein
VKRRLRNTKNDESRYCHFTNFGSIPFKKPILSTIGFSNPSTTNIPEIINIINTIISNSTGPISLTDPVKVKFPVIINSISIEYYGKLAKA